MKKKVVIHVGPYTVSYYPPIPRAGKHNIWLEFETGEGMSVDLDKLWEGF